MALLSSRPARSRPAEPSPAVPEAAPALAVTPPEPSPPPASAPAAEASPTQAARLAREAAEKVDTEALARVDATQAEVTAAAGAVAHARDPGNFPGTDEKAALAQLIADRAATKREAAALAGLASAKATKVETAAMLATAKRSELECEAETLHWGCEWAGRALIAAVQATPEGRPVQGLAAAVTLCREAVFNREQMRAELVEAKIAVPKVKPDSIAADLAGLLDQKEQGEVSTYATSLSVARWLATTAQREGARREMNRHRDLASQHLRRVQAASGTFGPDEQRAAVEATRKELAEYQKHRAPGFGMSAPPEEARFYAANARLAGQI